MSGKVLESKSRGSLPAVSFYPSIQSLKTVVFALQAAETQILLESLQNQLRDERQRNADLQEEVGGALIPVSMSSCSLLLDGFSPCEQMLRMSQELQAGGAQSSALEVDRLLSDVAALTTERDQLKEDMKENVDMV